MNVLIKRLASLEQVLMAEYHLNRNYILRGEAVINELYEFLGLEPTDWGGLLIFVLTKPCSFERRYHEQICNEIH